MSAYQIGSAPTCKSRQNAGKAGAKCWMRVWLMEREVKIQVRTCRVEANKGSCGVKQCKSYIWNPRTLGAVTVMFVLLRSGGGHLRRLVLLRTTITPARPICTRTHIPDDVLSNTRKTRRDKCQNAANLQYELLTCHIAKKIRDTQRTRDSM